MKATKLWACFAAVILIRSAAAQQCNCSESFAWMVSTFEKNDAGFQYVIDKKGTADYNKFTDLLKQKAEGISTLNDCQTVMSDWLHYFRPGHIGVFIKEPDTNEKEASDDEIRQKYKNTRTIALTEEQLAALLEKKHNKNPVEGIWSYKDYAIGIVADEKSNTKFTAFIIKADSVYWMPGQVKAEFTLNNDNKTFTVNYYKKDHFVLTTQAELLNKSGTLLSIYNNIWAREKPKSTFTSKDELMLAVSNATLPVVIKLSDKTIYLRIPSFEIGQKKNIDSVLAKYDSLITSTPNLIIDIRNGTGGADKSYQNIIPYLYTNPIRVAGVQILATELNAQGYEYYAKQYTDTESAAHCKDIAARMRANTGKFINPSETVYETDSLPHVLPYPRAIGIIGNHNNASADEQFLLAARQSKKVKIFGTPTRGVLDISNVHIVDFADGQFVLAYGMSKSYRIPDYCIDGVGVQPDYLIDAAVPEEDWIEYAQGILER
jgi:TfoX/Sxy family transcriptional regulator of competence genes